jgi:hypothetical protein
MVKKLPSRMLFTGDFLKKLRIAKEPSRTALVLILNSNVKTAAT